MSTPHVVSHHSKAGRLIHHGPQLVSLAAVSAMSVSEVLDWVHRDYVSRTDPLEVEPSLVAFVDRFIGSSA